MSAEELQSPLQPAPTQTLPSREHQLFRYRLASLHAALTCFLPRPLWKIFSLYWSDKHEDGGHHYGFTYGEYLRPFRYRRIKLLEIGVGGYRHALGGRSLLAWKAFFPFGRIVACDLLDKRELSSFRTKVYQVDQSSTEALSRLQDAEAPFDIIIDDGSHLNSHQIFTFETLLDSLAEGGLYIVEDVQTSFWPGEVIGTEWGGRHIDDPLFSETCVGYFLEMSKYLNHAEFIPGARVDAKKLGLAKKIRRISFEHNLIIIMKGTNDEPSNIVHDPVPSGPKSTPLT